MNSSESAAPIIKTLGHPLRLKIVVGLITQPKCVMEIWECLNVPQAVVSQHLAKLRNYGIIEGKRNGVKMQYTVIDPMVKNIVEYLTSNEVKA